MLCFAAAGRRTGQNDKAGRQRLSAPRQAAQLMGEGAKGAPGGRFFFFFPNSFVFVLIQRDSESANKILELNGSPMQSDQNQQHFSCRL